MSEFQIISEYNMLLHRRETTINSILSSIEKSMELNIINKKIKDMKRIYNFLK